MHDKNKTHTTALTSEKNKAYMAAKKAAGMLAAVIAMMERDEYCPSVIQQIDAVEGLLTSTKKELLKGHLNHCLHGKLREDKEKTVHELIKIFKLT